MKYQTDKFMYVKKQVVKDPIGTYYAWYLIDKETREGVHFHGIVYTDKETKSLINDENRHGFSTYGIESHRKAPKHENHTPVKNCYVTGGDCYCDGSSLQARERLGFINPDDKRDDQHIWNVLHEYYKSWIEETYE